MTYCQFAKTEQVLVCVDAALADPCVSLFVLTGPV